MKKSGKKTPRANKRKAERPGAAPTKPTRRRFLSTLGIGAGGVVALGAGGWWVSSSIQAHAREQDLSRVGRGVPSVVQVHDPQCGDCTVLQKELRKALKCFEETELVYVVASLTNDAGRIFAGRFGAGRVTLLLFDAEGRLQQASQGIQDQEALKAMFTHHIA